MTNTADITITQLYNPEAIKHSFVAAAQQTLNNLGQDEAIHVRMKLIELLGQWSPAFIASTESLQEVSDFIFTDETLRDWILNTKFVFYMNVAAGTGNRLIQALVRDIAYAASDDMGALDMLQGDVLAAAESEASAMPTQVEDDLSTSAECLATFSANTWLVVPMLMFAFLDLDHEILQTEVPDQQ